jgi:hypothetical protein
MIGDHDDPNEVDELDDEESTDELNLPTANVGETSVEIDVEELIAELEADSGISSGSSEEDPRKRLEKILEERRAARDLEEIDEFALDLHD